MADRAARRSWRRLRACWAKPLPASSAAKIEPVNFVPPYVEAIQRFVDLDLIAKSGFRFAIDCMYGAGAGILAGIFSKIGVDYIEIRANHDPLFPGINPEPIEPHIRACQEIVVEEKCDAGLITDGDADRIGAADENGNFVDPHKIYSVILQWILERKDWPGGVTRAFNTTSMLDRIAARYGRKLYEHGIGFKYVCDLMLTEDILIGGEESGGIGIRRHLPERDGLLNALLIANVMAEEKKTLGQLVARLQKEYGEHQYGRIDLHIPDALKNATIARAKAGMKEFAGMTSREGRDAGRGQVLARQSRGKNEAERREDLAAAARVGHGAAAADLLRVVLEGVGEEAAGCGAGIRDEFRKLRVPGLAWRPDQPGIVLRAHRYFHIYGIGAILSCMKPASVRTTVDIPADLYRQLKEQAAARGCSVRELVLAGVQKCPSERTEATLAACSFSSYRLRKTKSSTDE